MAQVQGGRLLGIILLPTKCCTSRFGGRERSHPGQQIGVNSSKPAAEFLFCSVLLCYCVIFLLFRTCNQDIVHDVETSKLTINAKKFIPLLLTNAQSALLLEKEIERSIYRELLIQIEHEALKLRSRRELISKMGDLGGGNALQI